MVKIKTIFHWKIICKYFIHALLVISGGEVVMGIIIFVFNLPLPVSLLGPIIGGLLGGVIFSCIYSKKYSLYHFEERKYENG